MKRNLLFFAILISLSVSTAGAQPPKNGAASEDIEIERTVELKQIVDSKEFAAAIDLGNLPVGRQVVLQLTLRNPYDEEIHFSGTEKRCACSQFKADRKRIPEQGELLCHLRVKTPATQKSLAVSTPVVLVQNEIPVVRLDLNYRLDGLLAFSELMNVVRFENGEQTKELKIPILTSLPVDVRKVQVSKSENLQDLKFEIVAGDNGGYLQATATDAILEKGEVRGELTIVYPETGQSDRYYLIIKDARSSEISPRVVRFRRQREGLGLTATVTVRIVGKLNTGNPDVANSESEPISCWHAGVKIPHQTKQLSDGVYRVDLLVDENDSASLTGENRDSTSEPDVLNWKINNGESETELKTPFIVDPPENMPNG